VAVFVGSLRKASINRKVANALIELAPAELKLSIVEIGQIYNQDSEENPTPHWIQLRERIKAAAAVLFATPEYSRSVPAALKTGTGQRPTIAHLRVRRVSPESQCSAPARLGVFICRQSRHILGSQAWRQEPPAQ